MASNPDDALRAAREQKRQRERDSRDESQQGERELTAKWLQLRERWMLAAKSFLELKAKDGYPDATIIRLYQRGPRIFFPKVAAWPLWHTQTSPDSQSLPHTYYILADGRLAWGGENPQLLELNVPRPAYAGDVGGLAASVEALESRIAR